MVRVGELTVDLDSRLVKRGGEIISLTRTEWNLLQCLTANADQLMGNAELLGKVWGPEYIGDLQYLRVWISRLRSKIDRNPADRSVVRTFPGIGYMLTTRTSGDAGEDDSEQAVDAPDAGEPGDGDENPQGDEGTSNTYGTSQRRRLRVAETDGDTLQ